jgi:hypothetical protein
MRGKNRTHSDSLRFSNFYGSWFSARIAVHALGPRSAFSAKVGEDRAGERLVFSRPNPPSPPSYTFQKVLGVGRTGGRYTLSFGHSRSLLAPSQLEPLLWVRRSDPSLVGDLTPLFQTPCKKIPDITSPYAGDCEFT